LGRLYHTSTRTPYPPSATRSRDELGVVVFVVKCSSSHTGSSLFFHLRCVFFVAVLLGLEDLPANSCFFIIIGLPGRGVAVGKCTSVTGIFCSFGHFYSLPPRRPLISTPITGLLRRSWFFPPPACIQSCPFLMCS